MSFELKRFSSDKKEQLEQFVAYAQLMGLSGRDLMAIGGKIDREEKKVRKNANMEIIDGFDCRYIGRDSGFDINQRFKLRTTSGDYNFQNDGWDMWEITSLKTKVRQRVHVNMWDYDLPKTNYYQQRSRWTVLLDIAKGRITLNF